VDVVLALQNNTRARFDLPGGASAAVEEVRTGAARFEVLVDVVDDYGPGGVPAGIEVTVEYQADTFEPSTVEWLADALSRVLDTMAAQERADGRPIAALDTPPLAWHDRDEDVAGSDRAPAPRGYVAPRTDLERRLAVVWADVLGVNRVGVHDNFFNLGGNSLRAVRVAARIATAERLPATATQIFAAPTIAELTRALAGAAPDEPARIPRLPRLPRTRPASPTSAEE
jgi:non-ribosomal peptide synthetase component F